MVIKLLLDGCIVQDVVGSSTRITGFELSNRPLDNPMSNRAVIRNCTAMNIANTQLMPSSESGAYGFFAGVSASDPVSFINTGSDVHFFDCVAQNVSFAAQPEQAIGFCANSLFGLRIDGCVSSDNGVGYSLDIAPEWAMAFLSVPSRIIVH